MNNFNFENLALEPAVLANLASIGYTQMTPIQAESLELILDNRDVIAQAKTGSGKTAAFGLGLLAKIDVGNKNTQALVLCPTRELCEQVAKEIRKLAQATPNIKVLTLCGGTPLAPQRASLEHGAHCIVGTPGRIQDHLSKKTLDLRFVETLVLDEADRMLDMGFLDEINHIVSFTPKSRQTLLFSATFPDNILGLSRRFQKNVAEVKVDTQHDDTQIEQLFFEAPKNQSIELVAKLLATYQPSSTLIFCNTKIMCHELAKHLQEMGFSAQAIHGDLEQRDRDRALALFGNKSTSILVATDVAARGLDVKDLAAVINFELSPDPEVHVHRIGRTGRAGNTGLAFSIFSQSDKHRMKAIADYQNQPILFGNVNSLSFPSQFMMSAPMATIRIGGGKKHKLRPGDILGALTKDNVLTSSDIGKIDIFDFQSYAAVCRSKIRVAMQVLESGKIKGRGFKASVLN